MGDQAAAPTPSPRTADVRQGYYRLLAACGVSVLGDAIYKIVLMWWVLSETGSLVFMASVAAASALTSVVLGTLSGAVSDLIDKRKFMVAGDAVRGLLLVAMAVQMSRGGLSIAFVIFYTILLSAIQSVYLPSLMAWMPELVETDNLVGANATFQSAQTMGSLLGPALGGFVMASAGASVGFLIDAATFVFSSIMIATIRAAVAPRGTVPVRSARQVLRKAREGLKVVRKDPVVSYLLVTTALLNLLIVPLILYLPAIVQRIYHLGAVHYGYLETAMPVGVLVGSLALTRLGFRSASMRLALWAVLAQGVLHVLFGVVGIYWLAFVLLIVIGVQMAVAGAVGRSILQERVARETRGTVFGFMSLLTSSLQPIGMSLAGVLGETVGTTPIVMASGIGLVAVAAVGLRLRVLRAAGGQGHRAIVPTLKNQLVTLNEADPDRCA